MRTLFWAGASLLAASAGKHSLAGAAIEEAGSLTSVDVEALLYDTATSGGCGSAGCVGDNTRDGDATTAESRWSCKPELGTDGSICSITYTLGDTLALDGLNIAMYKGDIRTRTIGVYVDGVLQTSWTSSGTTTDFESVALGASGQVVELRGVLEDSEWLSIMEVEIMADDGVDDDDHDGGAGDDDGAIEVEAGTLATVTATAALYDTSLGDSNGCDPDGCTAALTRDGDMSEGSRWSCASSLGGTCSISYDLGAVRNLSQLRLAMYQGATRVRTVDVSVDGALATTWTSSGTTSDFETIDLSGYYGRDITITGVLADSEWLSIIETEIMVLSDGIATPPSPAPITPAPVPAPVSAPVEIGTIGTVMTSASLFDPSLVEDGGCDPSGCTAALTRDGDYAESSRWSCATKLGDDGDTCTISYDLGQVYIVSQVLLAMYKGTERQTTVEVRVDGALITTWTSSGTTDDLQSITFTGVSGQVLEVTGVLADSEWLSIVETQIMVWSDSVITNPPSPTPSPTPSSTGELATVALIPMAMCSDCTGDDLSAIYVKDGDLSTSWACTPGTDDCTFEFDLFYYRHIKQVKIALPDGAERAVNMKISGREDSTLAESFVTSSGTTDGFETYDFDVFTSSIQISGLSDDTQTFSISEVEFVEEVQAGEISVYYWSGPYIGDGYRNEPTADPFQWSSDSDEVLGLTLSFRFAFFAMVDAVEIKFPVGDTFKFDLMLDDEKVDGETLKTITGFESTDTADWQYFDLSQHLEEDEYLTEIGLIIQGTGSGAPGFAMLDLRILGTVIDNPTDTLYVGSAAIEGWSRLTDRYPDFVAAGTGDQKAIMGAICQLKKASFDGVDCVGGDDAATGTIILPQGNFYVDGNIFMKSGIYLEGRFSEDVPYYTGIMLEEGAAGNTDTDAMIVMDYISDAMIDDIWIRGLYDPDTSNDSPAVAGLGSTGLSVVGSTNTTLSFAEIRYIGGDALVVRDSNVVNIDAGRYMELFQPWSIASSRGTGLIVDSCDSVWIRRHTMYNNGVAGIHIAGSNNVTFEATFNPENMIGEGSVGSTNGQQPIEIIIESSTLVAFNDMRVFSSNDPIMTVMDSSSVSFSNMLLGSIATDTCVIQTDDPTTVAVDDDEVTLDGTCYVKVQELA